MPNYCDYLKEKFSKPGEVFTGVELMAAAKLYNMPMIWKGEAFNAFTNEGNQKEAIYLHKRGMLVHKSQTSLLEKFRGSLDPFKARKNFRNKEPRPLRSNSGQLSDIIEEPESAVQSIEEEIPHQIEIIEEPESAVQSIE